MNKQAIKALRKQVAEANLPALSYPAVYRNAATSQHFVGEQTVNHFRRIKKFAKKFGVRPAHFDGLIESYRWAVGERQKERAAK